MDPDFIDELVSKMNAKAELQRRQQERRRTKGRKNPYL